MKSYFILSLQLLFFSCYANNSIDLFLQNTLHLSNKHFLGQIYNENNAQGYARQFEKLFPALYQKDKAEGIQLVENRLIIRLIKLIDSLQKDAHGLSWCNCAQAPAHLRIRLALEVFDRVVRQFPDAAQKLAYTSYASGKLLQDIIIIAGLIELGYANLIIHLIDLAYERKRQDLASLYAPVIFKKLIRSFTSDKQQKDSSYYPAFEVKTYYDVYEYVHDIQCGTAVKSHIVLMVDPGSDLLHEDFQYFGPHAQASLINFELANGMTHVALYIPRSKNIRYFYAQNLLTGDKEKIKKALQEVQVAKLKKNFAEYLVQAVSKYMQVKKVTYFQSPFRSLDDLKHDCSVDRAIMYQLCEGIIVHDVRDGLPLKNYSKVWL